jgi:hypothetical protein
MRRSLWKSSSVAAALVALSALQGCGGGGGGGGGGGTVTGLSAPSQMNVVTPSQNVSSSSLARDVKTLGLGSFPADADYYTDSQRVHVFDPSTEPISTVDMILCMLDQTRYVDLVNAGDYIAQVDQTSCGDGSDDSGDATGQSSAGKTPQLHNWVVNSFRASAADPQVVHAWVPEKKDGGGGPMTIRAKLTVTSGVSANDPFGAFKLCFAGVDDAAPDVANPLMHGVLETVNTVPGSIGFTFFEQDGDVNVAPAANHHAENVRAVVQMAADHSSGVAHVVSQRRENFPPSGDTGIVTEDFLVAFDADHLVRSKDGGPTLAFFRDTFDKRVWRYSLYENNGANAGKRVDLNSGFPFKTQSGGYGYLGYYGLWTPPGTTLHTGDVIEKQTFGNATATNYTLTVAPGRLTKFTRNTLALANLGSNTFELFDGGGPGVPPSRFRVVYQNSEFDEVAVWDDASQTFTTLPQPVAVDTAAKGVVFFYSQTLNGPVNYHDGDSFVTYYAQTYVGPQDSMFVGGQAVPLYGYFQCLKGGTTTAEADVGDVFLPDSQNVAAPNAYVFDPTTLTLQVDSDGDGVGEEDAGLAAGQTVDSGPFMWGMRSGPLVTDTTGLVHPWDVFGLDVFYVYETGPNDWNHYVAATDSNGVAVQFDPPVQFSYVHAQANDRNDDASHAGETYFLNYGGAGNLWGLPNAGIDLDGDGNPDRWYPIVNLKDGVVMGPTGTEYVVKALEIEESLELDGAYAGSLDVSGAAALTLPDGSTYVTPDNGATPVVTDPPAVVAGQLQGTAGG